MKTAQQLIDESQQLSAQYSPRETDVAFQMAYETGYLATALRFMESAYTAGHPIDRANRLIDGVVITPNKAYEVIEALQVSLSRNDEIASLPSRELVRQAIQSALDAVGELCNEHEARPLTENELEEAESYAKRKAIAEAI